MKIRLGVKVWSTNLSLIAEAQRIFDDGKLDYVEVFCVPDSVGDTAARWAESHLPLIVHAPHSAAGLNFSNPDQEARNIVLASESLQMADILHADTVIFHPGIGGSLEETIRQIRPLTDARMILENKPYRGLDGSYCIGSNPAEMVELTESLGIGFCLDFGHAIAAANSYKEPIEEFILRFLALKPRMYHLTDGELASELDHHNRYGEGSFPLRELLSYVPTGARVTDEAMRTDPNSLNEYVHDRDYAVRLLEGGAL